MLNDYRSRAVLITGGTKGIGLATGLAFGSQGANVYLTHRWGSVDEAKVREQFSAVGAPSPEIVESDVSVEADTQRLIAMILERHDRVEAFVSNVCVVPTTNGIESFSKRALFKSIEYSAWPFVAYLQQIKKAFKKLPRYVIGISSDGPDHYYQGYEYVAISKMVMEVFCRYLTKHLMSEDIRINIVRTRNVITDSALAIHGENYPSFVEKYASPTHFISADQVGQTIFALCSGLLDAMAGQIINVDKGGPFHDNLMWLYRHRDQCGL